MVVFVALLGARTYSSPAYAEYGPASAGPESVNSAANGHITNIYAFDSDGARLIDVRLYDGNGAPIDVGVSSDFDPFRRRVLPLPPRAPRRRLRS